ncbi:hypothetical protein BKA66DRAFT_569242 [Pyrenochaeta sp. MPI-SDFR-AT-0127]|nr:hypothetical protein BKA66DRAFT_569242 [Pyrenochaeta sp. MPI-SDFR-AT-0127]
MANTNSFFTPGNTSDLSRNQHEAHFMNDTPALRPQAEFFMRGVVPVVAQSPGENCTICSEPLDDDVVQVLACLHCFHCICIATWLQGNENQNRTCPNCRRELYDAPPHHDPLAFQDVEDEEYEEENDDGDDEVHFIISHFPLPDDMAGPSHIGDHTASVNGPPRTGGHIPILHASETITTSRTYLSIRRVSRMERARNLFDDRQPSTEQESAQPHYPHGYDANHRQEHPSEPQGMHSTTPIANPFVARLVPPVQAPPDRGSGPHSSQNVFVERPEQATPRRRARISYERNQQLDGAAGESHQELPTRRQRVFTRNPTEFECAGPQNPNHLGNSAWVDEPQSTANEARDARARRRAERQAER